MRMQRFDGVQCDMSPEADTLRSMRTANLSWATALGELIDNSFDAAAKNISITVTVNESRKKLVISDDGIGCPVPHKMLKQGAHNPHASTVVGMYGVGLKLAATWLWGTVRIATTVGGTTAIVAVTWEDQLLANSWRSPPIRYVESGAKSGTKIEFSNIEGRNIKSYASLIAALEYTFSPALSDGRTITFSHPGAPDGVALKPWKLPPLTDVVEASFDVDGKAVQLVAGMVAEGHKNSKPGLAVQYGHRVITSIDGGFGNRAGAARICGIVKLGSGWRIGSTKSELSCDDEKGRLDAAIAQHCAELFEKAASAAEHLCNSELLNELNLMLEQTLGFTRREKRDATREKSGTVEPANSGRKRRNASKTHDREGGVIGRARMRGIVIEFSPNDEGLAGWLNTEGTRVYLNPEHETVMVLRDAANRAAIHQIVLSIVAAEHVQRSANGQVFLPGMADFNQFIPCLSHLMLKNQLSEPNQQDEGDDEGHRRVSVHDQANGRTARTPLAAGV
jgi:anti-sigma regulatory factor (Ser/Thr protein kinase)